MPTFNYYEGIMNDWLGKNIWTVIIGVVTVISSYAVYGYRINALEQQVTANTTAIATQQNNDEQVQVELAQIETDVQYIKAYLAQGNERSFPDITATAQ